MNNNVVLTNKVVKRIDPVLDYLPRLGLSGKQINRQGLIKGVKAGNSYVIPFTVTFTDYTTWSSTFQIKKMFKDDQKRDMIMVYEQKLGQFGIYFDSLRGGKFKNEMQVAWNDAVALQDTYKKELEATQKSLANQEFQTKVAREANVKKDSEISILKGDKAVLEMELEDKKYELVAAQSHAGALEAVINTLKENEFSAKMAKQILFAVRYATAKGKGENTVEDIIKKIIDDKIAELIK